LVDHGNIMLEAQKAWCRDILRRVRGETMIGGYNVPIANVPHELRDIAGEILYQGVPFSATYEDRHGDGVRKVSLRSCRENGIDVEEIAKIYGGSGHPHAAGFSLPLTKTILDSATGEMLSF
jgi:uncharacterized protein